MLVTIRLDFQDHEGHTKYTQYTDTHDWDEARLEVWKGQAQADYSNFVLLWRIEDNFGETDAGKYVPDVQ